MDFTKLGVTKSGWEVYDRMNSHVHRSAVPYMEEALLMVDSTESFVVAEVDLGRLIGVSTCVKTDLNDEVVYAQRVGRSGLTRFVLNRSPEPSQKMLIILKKRSEVPNSYLLMTAFIGEKAEPEPWDPRATEHSVPFWSTHALIWGSEEIVKGTETKQSPY